MPAAAQLREGRPALAAFLQNLPALKMPDVGHRLLGHALDLALRAVGLDREDAVHLGARSVFIYCCATSSAARSTPRRSARA